jgi:hypothetical protein
MTKNIAKEVTQEVKVTKEPEFKPESQPEAKKTGAKRRPLNITRKQATSGLIVLLLLILSFVSGQYYEKSSQNSNPASKTAMRSGRFGGTGMSDGTGGLSGGTGGRSSAMRGGVFGQVTAVSATSITVQNVRTNSDSTLTISGTTTVTDNGQAAAISDVKVGDNVLVRASTTDTGQAAQITLNPQTRGSGGPGNMGGGGMGAGSTPQGQQNLPQTPSQTD